ncbi:hypothetical protein FRC03_000211 [Tulasnella sp. 419]|nr:hypothetical protein FRC03_000211 [Tulasnella sp. 419]
MDSLTIERFVNSLRPPTSPAPLRPRLGFLREREMNRYAAPVSEIHLTYEESGQSPTPTISEYRSTTTTCIPQFFGTSFTSNN